MKEIVITYNDKAKMIIYCDRFFPATQSSVMKLKKVIKLADYDKIPEIVEQFLQYINYRIDEYNHFGNKKKVEQLKRNYEIINKIIER